MIKGRQAIIRTVCNLLDNTQLEEAGRLIDADYPFIPITKTSRQYTPRQMTDIFVRDGFIDRYRGTKLVYPPALRLISHYLPKTFPYHKNGKMDMGHIAFWELFPTIDHVIPISRGGEDTRNNWVCCSMITNSMKSNWLLEELGWELNDPGKLSDWDGMFSWFKAHVTKNPSLLTMSYIKTWYNAAKVNNT
ncbi:MAG: HNH endonuclease [Candidatus Margulisiibacteriota bacterium]|nr:MAG: HNH endonuclease [Candidatus Margulisiibacteriota bacterium]